MSRFFLHFCSRDDWIENGVYYGRNLTNIEKLYYIKLGVSSQMDCSGIGEKQELLLYVHPDSHSLCQGWKHHLNLYPDDSNFHPNSAIKVQCVDGGVTYSQYTSTDCRAGSQPMKKRDYYGMCHQGHPQTVYLQITDFSGCRKLGFKETG